MASDLASGLRFAAQPVVSVFVPGTPVVSPNFVFGGTTPAEVRTYSLEQDDPPGSFPCARVTEFDLVFDVLPADLGHYLEDCLKVACSASASVVWMAFEGSFHFDHILTEAIAPQVYGICAPGDDPVIVPDLETLKTPHWRSVVASYRSRL
ncbi:hypothetical protein GCM10028790_12440 [Micromonospora taraxaci]|uniref:Uncharacterized protein n=1 Tax=Micromonospora taraxaci TaxID=1316803 RepID=A0A561W8V6_9ACTN|nr:hypothetical protein [Micromonospora taraxaci]TWG20291.1 hypothetical protein FHU34_115688 [Micromonospora taraxaci]